MNPAAFQPSSHSQCQVGNQPSGPSLPEDRWGTDKIGRVQNVWSKTAMSFLFDIQTFGNAVFVTEHCLDRMWHIVGQ